MLTTDISSDGGLSFRSRISSIATSGTVGVMLCTDWSTE
jgi:hypothetical protein